MNEDGAARVVAIIAMQQEVDARAVTRFHQAISVIRPSQVGVQARCLAFFFLRGMLAQAPSRDQRDDEHVDWSLPGYANAQCSAEYDREGKPDIGAIERGKSVGQKLSRDLAMNCPLCSSRRTLVF